MRKMAFGMSIFTFIAAVAGYLLRKTELATVFDAETGLAARWAPVSIGLALVSVVFTLGLILFSVRMGNVRKIGGYKEAFSPNGVSVTLFLMLLGLGIAGASVFGLIDLFILPKSLLSLKTAGAVDAVFYIFGLACGISVLVLARGAYRGSAGSELCLCSLIPVFFLCFWLILLYKARAADPVMLDYVYEFLAVCASILAFYYAAGYAFGKPQPKRAAFFGYLSAYLCAVTLADGHGIANMIILTCLMLSLFLNSYLMVGNMISDGVETPRAADDGAA